MQRWVLLFPYNWPYRDVNYIANNNKIEIKGVLIIYDADNYVSIPFYKTDKLKRMGIFTTNNRVDGWRLKSRHCASHTTGSFLRQDRPSGSRIRRFNVHLNNCSFHQLKLSTTLSIGYKICSYANLIKNVVQSFLTCETVRVVPSSFPVSTMTSADFSNMPTRGCQHASWLGR